MQAKSCTCVPKWQEKNHTLACALKKKTNLHQHICAHHPSPRTLLFLNRSQSRDSTLAQPSDRTGGKTSLKTNAFLEGINSSSQNWHRYLISKQAYYLGQFRNKPRALSSPLKNNFGQMLDRTEEEGKWGVLLPKHTRPVPSRVSPSGHSQWKEPLLLMHRPLGQTPGKTSHSLTSVGTQRGQLPAGPTGRAAALWRI